MFEMFFSQGFLDFLGEFQDSVGKATRRTSPRLPVFLGGQPPPKKKNHVCSNRFSRICQKTNLIDIPNFGAKLQAQNVNQGSLPKAPGVVFPTRA